MFAFDEQIVDLRRTGQALVCCCHAKLGWHWSNEQATIEREWSFSRAWLYDALADGAA